MPTTIGPRVVPEHIAGELADFFAVQHDLEATLSYVARVKEEWSDPRTADWGLVNAISDAAVVRYARCFAQGCRSRLGEADVPPDLIETHRWALNLRNRHIAHAHPVNDFEQGSVQVQVVEAPAPRQVHGVSMGIFHAAGLAPVQADELVALCTGVLAQLRPRIEQLRVEVEALVKTLPVEQVYSWPEFALALPSGKQRPPKSRRT
jgi:hypothetical protein